MVHFPEFTKPDHDYRTLCGQDAFCLALTNFYQLGTCGYCIDKYEEVKGNEKEQDPSDRAESRISDETEFYCP